MNVYHFSDAKYQVGEKVPVGNFGKFISTAKTMVIYFEELMERERIQADKDSISRLNCLFTFSASTADGFKSNRKFLYELDLPDGVRRDFRNHAIPSYFAPLFSFNYEDIIDDEVALIKSYWQRVKSTTSSSGIQIPYEEEILVAAPLFVTRIIKL